MITFLATLMKSTALANMSNSVATPESPRLMSVKVYRVQEQMAAMVTGLFVAKLLMINEGHKWNEAQKRVHKSPSHANSNNSNRTIQEDIALLSSLGSMSTEAFGKNHRHPDYTRHYTGNYSQQAT